MEYPEIATVDQKLKIIEELGYEIIGVFVLPIDAWTTNYYDHLKMIAHELEQEWKDIPEAMEIIKEAKLEIKMFKQYQDYFSYSFFVIKK